MIMTSHDFIMIKILNGNLGNGKRHKDSYHTTYMLYWFMYCSTKLEIIFQRWFWNDSDKNYIRFHIPSTSFTVQLSFICILYDLTTISDFIDFSIKSHWVLLHFFIFLFDIFLCVLNSRTLKNEESFYQSDRKVILLK